MKILSFIPARGSSERIPNKNIKMLNGKPLISYTIECAGKSRFINRVVVSTDSAEIADVAVKYGAEVPFMRPASISNSNSTEMEFFEHALTWFKDNEDYTPDLIVLLYPTSPFRKTESIDKAIELMLDNSDADSLRSIKLCSEHPYKMWISKDKYIEPFAKTDDPNMQTLSTQLFPKVYIQNASIYITKVSTIRNKKSPIGDKVIPFIMDEIESVDINTYLDFEFAEMICGKERILSLEGSKE
ncbi:cytidylyltransferase domain-containing protein [bacterium]